MARRFPGIRATAGARHGWLSAGLAVAAGQVALTLSLPESGWPFPLGVALLALLCAGRTASGAADVEGADRWRWMAATAAMVAAGLQWTANAFFQTLLAFDYTLPSLLVVIVRAAVVVSLLPLTKVDDGPLFRWLDAGQGAIFALLLALLSWPGLVSGAGGMPDIRYMFLGYGAMTMLAIVAFLAERSGAVRRLIVAMGVAQILYGAGGIVATLVFVRGLLAPEVPALFFADLSFLAYLFLIGRPAAVLPATVSQTRLDGLDMVSLPPRMVPALLTLMIVALAFAMAPRAWVAAGIVTMLALMVHVARAWATEDRFRTRQAEVLMAVRVRIDKLADLLHEVRSPLGLISLNAGLIGRNAVRGEAVAPLTDAIQDRCRTITILLDAMLDLEKIEARMVPLDLRPCSLRPIVAQQVAALAVKAETFGVRLENRVGDIVVLADEIALARILTNLLDNALRFTPAGQSIRIESVATGTHAEIHIADTGTGLLEEVASTLFSRFAPSGIPIHGSRGTGLGLSICRALAQSMNGDLRHVPKSGPGTTMVLVLPRIARTKTAIPTGHVASGEEWCPEEDSNLHGLATAST